VNRGLYVAARATVRTVNTPVAKLRLRRELAHAPRPLKVEIGGIAPRDGWVVTNVNAKTRNFLDATVRWPVEDGSVQFVYNDNVIEHLTLEAGRAMLRQAYRAMTPGGVIRTVTPDIRQHVDLYLAGASSVTGPVGVAYRNKGLSVDHPVDLIRIPIGSFGHHEGYLYDFETLRAELEAAGFHSVVQVPPGQSPHLELSGLDLRSDEGGAQLAVEATK
jgi:hypothetical protein